MTTLTIRGVPNPEPVPNPTLTFTLGTPTGGAVVGRPPAIR